MKSTPLQIFQDCSRDLIGLPYVAFDCWELVKLFYLKVFNQDMNLKGTYQDPEDQVTISRLLEIEKNSFKKIGSPEFGDIVVLRIKGYTSHIGIYLGSGKFLHTLRATGSVIETTSKWNKRIEGYYRYDGY